MWLKFFNFAGFILATFARMRKEKDQAQGAVWMENFVIMLVRRHLGVD